MKTQSLQYLTKAIKASGCMAILMCLTACNTVTSIGIRSEPPKGWVYYNIGDPEFLPLQGIGPDNHSDTPTNMTLNWGIIRHDRNEAQIKIIWPDGTESRSAIVKRNSPDIRIFFTKNQIPKVEEFKKQ